MDDLLRDGFLLELVEHIYAAGCDPSEWPAFVAKVHSAVPESAVHALFDIEGTQILFNSASVGVPDDFVRSYLGGYYRINPYNDVFSRLPTGKIYTSSELGPPGWLKKDTFLNEWLIPAGKFTHGSGVVVERGPGRQLRVTVDLPTKLADSESIAARFLARIQPHLARAFQVNEKLAAAVATQQSLGGLVDRMAGAAFILDDRQRVIAANGAAQALVRARRTVRQAATGRLGFVEPQHEAAFRKALGGHVSGGTGGDGFAVRSADFPQGASAVVLPLRARAANLAIHAASPRSLMVITDARERHVPPAALLQAMYAMTPAESAAVLELCAGNNVQEAADRLGVSRVTARNQIAAAMAKMGVHRQAEVLAVVARLAPHFKIST